MGGMIVSRRVNEKFLELYMELDRLCCERFGNQSGGVTEYINRLNNARFAPDRDEVLPKLVNYRSIKYRFAAEPGIMKRSDELSGADVDWMRRFVKYFRKKKDPISAYVKRARRYMRMRKIRRIFAVVGLLLLLGLAAALAILMVMRK